MKNQSFILLLLIGFISTTPTFAQPKADAILGEWLSAKKDSRIQIYKQGNKYAGKILWGTGSDKKDSKNPDASLRSRDLIGLTLLNDFVFDGDATWADGTIYDPREGKTYACKMSLKSPDALNIRGYVGMSLFGRTEIWTRVH